MLRLFFAVLRMSLTACCVVPFVLLVRLLLLRAPRVFSYALWAAVWLRLVCPVSFESALSLVRLPRRALSPAAFAAAAPPAAAPAAALPAASAPDPLAVAGCAVWLAGAAAFLALAGFSILRLSRGLRGAVRVQGRVYEARNIRTPFVLGIWRPRIYLPASLGQEERRYILRHEEIHIRRLDHVIRPLCYAALCLHWFNPLAWLSFRLMCSDMEMSCDERVLRELGGQIRRDYSASLLALAAGRRVPGGPLAFGEGDVSGRIRHVLRCRRPAALAVAAAGAALLLALFCLVANPRQTRPSMQWAKGLRLSDVAQIELTVAPSAADACYRRFAPEEFGEIVRLINSSRGRYVQSPEAIAGSELCFTVTTTDGAAHTFINSGNYYLMIDGDCFDAGYPWLSAWHWQGDSPLPAGHAGWEENVLSALAASVAYHSGTGELSFAIPQNLGDGSAFFLHVSGRLAAEDGFSMSWHAFEEETQSGAWEPGKTYRATLDAQALDLISIEAQLSSARITVEVDAHGAVNVFHG